MSAPNFELINSEPSDEVIKKLNSIVSERMIIIGGKCTAIFDGRIKSTLEPGERLLIIKKDLSILMHGAKGVKPLNWQKPHAGPIRFLLKNGNLVMFTRRIKTQEELIITFTKIQFITTWRASDSTELEIYGDESDLVKYLVKKPEKIEEGLQILACEYSTEVGFVDIRAIDKNKKEVIIEVKKRNATPADAFQLKRYQEFFAKKEKRAVRAMLIAPSFPDNVKKYLLDNKLEYLEIPWKDIFPVLKRAKSASLDDFFNKK
ncbi:MAG: endonuclease NucS domain-containing protein [Candidatus Heimdallarchaeaceae archaeon]